MSGRPGEASAQAVVGAARARYERGAVVVVEESELTERIVERCPRTSARIHRWKRDGGYPLGAVGGFAALLRCEASLLAEVDSARRPDRPDQLHPGRSGPRLVGTFTASRLDAAGLWTPPKNPGASAAARKLRVRSNHARENCNLTGAAQR
jgi:hypothetical protein